MSNEESTNPTSNEMASAGTVESRIENLLYGEGESDTQPSPDEQPEQAAEETQEPEDAEEEQQAEASTDDQEAEEQATLAAHLGLEDDQLIEGEDGIYVNAKINGQVEKVKFNDLIKGYQTDKAVTQKSQALAEQRRAFEEQAQAYQAEYTGKLQRADEALQVIEENLAGEFNGIDWETLRREDPAEWAAKRQEMAQKYRQTKNTREKFKQEQQKVFQQQQAQQAQQTQLVMQQEAEKLLAKNPTWQDPEVRAQELSEIRGFLTESYGFADDDLQNVSDSRLVSLIQDAYKYRKLKTTAEPKQAKKVPKYIKPGKSKSSAAKTAAEKQAKQQRSSLKKSGSISDAAAILLNRM